MKTTLLDSHERVCRELESLVKCIRNFELGDYSPLMDEIFDSEHALRLASKFRPVKVPPKTLCEIFTS